MSRTAPFVALAVLLAAAVVSACGGDDDALPPPPTAPGDDSIAGLDLRLSVEPDPARAGDAITLTLEVGASEEPVELHYRTGQRYDFVVYNEQGIQVWRWAAGASFPAATGTMTFQPGGGVAYVEVWDSQRLPPGVQLAPGVYQAIGIVTGCTDDTYTRCGMQVGVDFVVRE